MSEPVFSFPDRISEKKKWKFSSFLQNDTAGGGAGPFCLDKKSEENCLNFPGKRKHGFFFSFRFFPPHDYFNHPLFARENCGKTMEKNNIWRRRRSENRLPPPSPAPLNRKIIVSRQVRRNYYKHRRRCHIRLSRNNTGSSKKGLSFAGGGG